jgi:hypothetical protein
MSDSASCDHFAEVLMFVANRLKGDEKRIFLEIAVKNEYLSRWNERKTSDKSRDRQCHEFYQLLSSKIPTRRYQSHLNIEDDCDTDNEYEGSNPTSTSTSTLKSTLDEDNYISDAIDGLDFYNDDAMQEDNDMFGYAVMSCSLSILFFSSLR